jgi:hypothetical protein
MIVRCCSEMNNTVKVELGYALPARNLRHETCLLTCFALSPILCNTARRSVFHYLHFLFISFSLRSRLAGWSSRKHTNKGDTDGVTALSVQRLSFGPRSPKDVPPRFSPTLSHSQIRLIWSFSHPARGCRFRRIIIAMIKPKR